jgi:hypothetical protein
VDNGFADRTRRWRIDHQRQKQSAGANGDTKLTSQLDHSVGAGQCLLFAPIVTSIWLTETIALAQPTFAKLRHTSVSALLMFAVSRISFR